jgi:hypothetical protein
MLFAKCNSNNEVEKDEMVRHVLRMEVKRNVPKLLEGKTEGKNPPRKP